MISIFNGIELSYVVIFGVLLTFAAKIAGDFIYKKAHYFPLLNGNLVAIVLIIAFLNIFGIDFETYYSGGELFTFLLFPTTAALAIPIYRQRKLLKAHFFPIIIGTAVGALVGMGSVYVMCRLFGYDDFLTHSSMAKSVTTAISMEVTKMLGGDVGIVLIGVNIAGLMASLYIPVFIKLTKLRNPIAFGIATGCTSHGFGTSCSMTISEEVGAMSGLAIGIMGLFTMLFAMILPW